VPPWFFLMSLGLFGLLFGSFANVVIWRLPRGESISHPASHCPACDAPIAWYDNVPLVSYALLRGRCRACAATVPARYPLVEAASSALFVLAGVRFGVSVQAIAAAVFLWGLLALALIDLEHFRLPNPLVATLAVVGFVGAAAAQLLSVPLVPLIGVGATGPLAAPGVAAAAGALASGGLALLVAESYAVVRRRQGLGMGDVKLLGVLGLFLGLYAFMALVIASILGSVVVLLLARRDDVPLGELKLPLGALLALGAAVAVFVGPGLWDWYLRLVGLA
jgi:leader peptidase (prepilin peptidase)/N-methyltransferase